MTIRSVVIAVLLDFAHIRMFPTQRPLVLFLQAITMCAYTAV